MTYADAMNAYGSDKPELRLPRFYRVEHLFEGTEFPKGTMPVVAFVIPKTGALSRKERGRFEGVRAGARGCVCSTIRRSSTATIPRRW